MGGEKKIHLVDWELVCKPKIEGGLDRRPLREMNSSFARKIAMEAWG